MADCVIIGQSNAPLIRGSANSATRAVNERSVLINGLDVLDRVLVSVIIILHPQRTAEGWFIPALCDVHTTRESHRVLRSAELLHRVRLRSSRRRASRKRKRCALHRWVLLLLNRRTRLEALLFDHSSETLRFYFCLGVSDPGIAFGGADNNALDSFNGLERFR